MKFVRGTVVFVVCVGLLACGDSAQVDRQVIDTDEVDDAATHVTSPGVTPRQASMWANSCAQCHVDGTAFAPRVGNHEEWSPRLAKGPQALLRATLEGLNDMPPLGYCMACEQDDFVAMINFMSAGLTIEPTVEVTREN